MSEGRERKTIHGFLVGEMKGENAAQSPAYLYTTGKTTVHDDPLALDAFRLDPENAPMSYNNWADLDNALQTLTHVAGVFKKNSGTVPHIAVGVKHGSVCGAGVAAVVVGKDSAVQKMVAGDPLALMGGTVLMNFGLDEEGANILSGHLLAVGTKKRFFDCIAAPAVSLGAKRMLERKNGRCRLLTNAALEGAGAACLDATERFRYIRGGFLVQPNYTFLFDWRDPLLLSNDGPVMMGAEEDCFLAWAVGATSKSNTVTIVYRGRVLGNAVSQQSRVGAAELAVARARDAGHEKDLLGAVAYSDSFFPFPDGLTVLLEAGIKTVLATRGSMNDDAVLATAAKYGARFITLPDEYARGFYGH